MRCDEAGELIAAFALDALPAEEAEQMRAHIETCERHASELANLRAAAAALALTAETTDAPAALRNSIIAAAARSPQDDPALPPSNQQPRPIRADDGQSAGTVRRAVSRLSWAPLAAAAAVIVALAIWNVTLLRSDDGGGEGALAVSGPVRLTSIEAADGGSGFVAYFPESGQALFVAGGLQPLDTREATYQLWAIVDGQATSLGLLDATSDGSVAAAVRLDDPAGSTLAVTVEPPGGSEQPTSAPILQARL